MIVRGGPSVAGAALGILMLEARFPRIVGEVGNALTWDFPVHYRVVRGASPERVVLRGAPGLLDAFIDAARELVAMGADGITTNCGFLSLFQKELAAAVAVPVASSSLMQAAFIGALLPPGRRVGIITISADTLSAAHLEAAGVGGDVAIVGTRPDCHFNDVILGNRDELDTGRARDDLLEAAARLVREHEGIGAILLECTNMCPYAAAIGDAVGRPVFDMAGFIRWFQSGLRPRCYV
ncbi:MAG: aspartate/glutamate racemase family protein [Geminicoccaceae bacterium]|nr:aspartate/glutamate racemase family protein [Geminicoccaceae bacterium]